MSAQDDADALQLIAAANNGRVTPDAVWQAAREPGHIWHDRFQWDVQAAAVEYWREQARSIIRSVHVVRHVEGRVITSVGYVRDPQAAPTDQGYSHVDRVRTDVDWARSVVLAEFARVASALRRASELAEMLGIKDEVDAMAVQMRALIVTQTKPEPPRAVQ